MVHAVFKLACCAWFGVWTVLGLLISWTGCAAITALVGRTIQDKQRRCCQVCHWLFRWFLIKTSPWVHVSTPPMEDVVRLMDRDRVFLMMNHTSFFDSVLFVGTTPPGIIWRYRTLMKNTLFKLPLLGSICTMVGHFPVFFQSKDENSFAVDKSEQAKVMDKLKAHVEANGSLCVFPEGKINRNPEVLCSFRRGLFAIAEEMQMPVVSLTAVGNNETWPVDAPIGGLPASIMMKITEIAEAGHGLPAATINERAQASMQADVDYLLAEKKRLLLKPKQN